MNESPIFHAAVVPATHAAPVAPDIAFDTSYLRLPERFYRSCAPTPVTQPRLLRLNTSLAATLRLDADLLASPDGVAILAGNAMPPTAASIACVYAGHQFGHFNPQLGDGRAILLGEILDIDGARRDIQLKGAGPTPFSRRGDGRAAMGPVLREYLVSEAMAALGIPTTRALAAVATGEWLFRDTAVPGAVLTRVAASHIRVGTFQFFAARGDVEAVRLLAEHVIARHYPEAASAPFPVRALLDGVIARQAALVARWLLVGFVHGVMNTDNMSVAGETIDYGPCAFLDAYDPATVFSSIDHAGRYAYGQQPRIAHWNLTRLAEALLPLLAEDEDASIAIAKDALSAFAPQFQAAYMAGLGRKLGLKEPRDGDGELAQGLLTCMAENRADFTRTFRLLCNAATGDDAVRAQFADPGAYDIWAARWCSRMATENFDASARADAMRAVNPAYIPRNHLVESALKAAIDQDDFAPFETLLEILANPYVDQPGRAAYATPPPTPDAAYRTFCGT